MSPLDHPQLEKQHVVTTRLSGELVMWCDVTGLNRVTRIFAARSAARFGETSSPISKSHGGSWRRRAANRDET